MANRRFYNLDPTPDNFRALWDKIHALEATQTSLQATITTHAATLSSQTAQLASLTKTAKQALINSIVPPTVAGVPNTNYPTGTPPSTTPVGGGDGGTPAPPNAVPIADHTAEVMAVYNQYGIDTSSYAGIWKFVQRVAWAIKDLDFNGGVAFPCGLLIKNGGTSYECSGVIYSISRVCYPDGHIFKVIVGADLPSNGGINTPEWSDNGFVDPSYYHVATDPSVPCT